MKAEQTGKVALITGASRGIGRAVALRLASEGAAIYLAADGTEAELEETAAACRKAGAPDAAWGIHDLTRPDEPGKMIGACHQRMKRIDILVNNAGLRMRKAFGEFSHEEFDRLVPDVGTVTARLTEPAEKALVQEVVARRGPITFAADSGTGYREALAEAAKYGPTVATFFDDVLVMAEDPSIRQARLFLMKALERQILRLADGGRLSHRSPAGVDALWTGARRAAGGRRDGAHLS